MTRQLWEPAPEVRENERSMPRTLFDGICDAFYAGQRPNSKDDPFYLIDHDTTRAFLKGASLAQANVDIREAADGLLRALDKYGRVKIWEAR